jgi:hypothetical protein
MLNYKKINPNKKNLPLSIDSGLFKKLWVEALEDKESDLNELLSLLEPFFQKLINQFLTFKNLDFTFMSLCQYISPDPKQAIIKITNWMNNTDSMYSDIVYCFIKRTRAIKKIPKHGRPLMVEYYFITDFKYELSKYIKKQKYNTNNTIKQEHSEVKLNIILENNWQRYLYNLYMQGYNNSEISQLTKLSRKTIIKEGEKLCQCLKHKL